MAGILSAPKDDYTGSFGERMENFYKKNRDILSEQGVDSTRLAQEAFRQGKQVEEGDSFDTWATRHKVGRFTENIGAYEQSLRQEKLDEETRQKNLTERSAFTRGVLSGVDQLQAGVQGGGTLLLSKLAQTLGGGDNPVAAYLRNKGIDIYQEQMQEASLNPTKSLFSDTEGTILNENLNGVGDYSEAVMGTLGNLAPSMAAGLLTGLVGTGIGAAGAVATEGAKGALKYFVANQAQRMIAKGVIGDVVAGGTTVAAKTIAERIAKKYVGGRAGAILGTAMMETGSNYSEAVDHMRQKFMAEGMHPEDALLKATEESSATLAMTTGLAAGLVEVMGGNIRLLDMVLGDQAGKSASELIKIATAKGASIPIRSRALNLLRDLGVEAAKQAPAEFGQESVQEILAMANVNYADPDFVMLSQSNFKRVLEAGVSGAIGGIGGGLATGAIGKTKESIGLEETPEQRHRTLTEAIARQEKLPADYPGREAFLAANLSEKAELEAYLGKKNMGIEDAIAEVEARAPHPTGRKFTAGALRELAKKGKVTMNGDVVDRESLNSYLTLQEEKANQKSRKDEPSSQGVDATSMKAVDSFGTDENMDDSLPFEDQVPFPDPVPLSKKAPLAPDQERLLNDAGDETVGGRIDMGMSVDENMEDEISVTDDDKFWERNPDPSYAPPVTDTDQDVDGIEEPGIEWEEGDGSTEDSLPVDKDDAFESKNIVPGRLGEIFKSRREATNPQGERTFQNTLSVRGVDELEREFNNDIEGLKARGSFDPYEGEGREQLKTLRRVATVLEKKIGSKGVEALEKSGILSVDWALEFGTKSGTYNSAERSAAIDPTQDDNEIWSSALHEVGAHHGIENIVRETAGEQGWENFRGMMTKAVKNDSTLQAAYQTVVESYVDAKDAREDLAELRGKPIEEQMKNDVFLHEVAARVADYDEKLVGGKVNQAIMWVRDKIVQFLRKAGVSVKLTAPEVARLLRGSLQRVTKDTKGQIKATRLHAANLDYATRAALGGYSQGEGDFEAQNKKAVRPVRIQSGMQDGADLGGLEAAKELGIETGGWMPKGFKAQSGAKPHYATEYGAKESESADYPERTMKNVDDNDGTVAFLWGKSTGTEKTIGYANTKRWGASKVAAVKGYKPVLVLGKDETVESAAEKIRAFVSKHGIKSLNVAGHRETTQPGIQKFVKDSLVAAFAGQESAIGLTQKQSIKSPARAFGGADLDKRLGEKIEDAKPGSPRTVQALQPEPLPKAHKDSKKKAPKEKKQAAAKPEPIVEKPHRVVTLTDADRVSEAPAPRVTSPLEAAAAKREDVAISPQEIPAPFVLGGTGDASGPAPAAPPSSSWPLDWEREKSRSKGTGSGELGAHHSESFMFQEGVTATKVKDGRVEKYSDEEEGSKKISRRNADETVDIDAAYQKFSIAVRENPQQLLDMAETLDGQETPDREVAVHFLREAAVLIGRNYMTNDATILAEMARLKAVSKDLVKKLGKDAQLRALYSQITNRLGNNKRLDLIRSGQISVGNVMEKWQPTTQVSELPFGVYPVALKDEKFGKASIKRDERIKIEAAKIDEKAPLARLPLGIKKLYNDMQAKFIDYMTMTSRIGKELRDAFDTAADMLLVKGIQGPVDGRIEPALADKLMESFARTESSDEKRKPSDIIMDDPGLYSAFRSAHDIRSDVIRAGQTGDLNLKAFTGIKPVSAGATPVLADYMAHIQRAYSYISTMLTKTGAVAGDDAKGLSLGRATRMVKNELKIYTPNSLAEFRPQDNHDFTTVDTYEVLLELAGLPKSVLKPDMAIPDVSGEELNVIAQKFEAHKAGHPVLSTMTTEEFLIGAIGFGTRFGTKELFFDLSQFSPELLQKYQDVGMLANVNGALFQPMQSELGGEADQLDENGVAVKKTPRRFDYIRENIMAAPFANEMAFKSNPRAAVFSSREANLVPKDGRLSDVRRLVPGSLIYVPANKEFFVVGPKIIDGKYQFLRFYEDGKGGAKLTQYAKKYFPDKIDATTGGLIKTARPEALYLLSHEEMSKSGIVVVPRIWDVLSGHNKGKGFHPFDIFNAINARSVMTTRTALAHISDRVGQDLRSVGHVQRITTPGGADVILTLNINGGQMVLEVADKNAPAKAPLNGIVERLAADLSKDLRKDLQHALTDLDAEAEKAVIERALERADEVIDDLHKRGQLTDDEANSLEVLLLDVASYIVKNYDRLADEAPQARGLQAAYKALMRKDKILGRGQEIVGELDEDFVETGRIQESDSQGALSKAEEGDDVQDKRDDTSKILFADFLRDGTESIESVVADILDVSDPGALAGKVESLKIMRSLVSQELTKDFLSIRYRNQMTEAFSFLSEQIAVAEQVMAEADQSRVAEQMHTRVMSTQLSPEIFKDKESVFFETLPDRVKGYLRHLMAVPANEKAKNSSVYGFLDSIGRSEGGKFTLQQLVGGRPQGDSIVLHFLSGLSLMAPVDLSRMGLNKIDVTVAYAMQARKVRLKLAGSDKFTTYEELSEGGRKALNEMLLSSGVYAQIVDAWKRLHSTVDMETGADTWTENPTSWPVDTAVVRKVGPGEVLEEVRNMRIHISIGTAALTQHLLLKDPLEQFSMAKKGDALDVEDLALRLGNLDLPADIGLVQIGASDAERRAAYEARSYMRTRSELFGEYDGSDKVEKRIEEEELAERIEDRAAQWAEQEEALRAELEAQGTKEQDIEEEVEAAYKEFQEELDAMEEDRISLDELAGEEQALEDRERVDQDEEAYVNSVVTRADMQLLLDLREALGEKFRVKGGGRARGGYLPTVKVRGDIYPFDPGEGTYTSFGYALLEHLRKVHDEAFTNDAINERQRQGIRGLISRVSSMRSYYEQHVVASIETAGRYTAKQRMKVGKVNTLTGTVDVAALFKEADELMRSFLSIPEGEGPTIYIHSPSVNPGKFFLETAQGQKLLPDAVKVGLKSKDGRSVRENISKSMGMIDKDGTIHIFPSMHANEQGEFDRHEFRRTLYHEIVAHVALSKVLGTEYEGFMLSVFKKYVAAGRMTSMTKESMILAAEEYLAHMIEQVKYDPAAGRETNAHIGTLVDKIAAMLTRFFRKVMLRFGHTTEVNLFEIRELLGKAFASDQIGSIAGRTGLSTVISPSMVPYENLGPYSAFGSYTENTMDKVLRKVTDKLRPWEAMYRSVVNFGGTVRAEEDVMSALRTLGSRIGFATQKSMELEKKFMDAFKGKSFNDEEVGQLLWALHTLERNQESFDPYAEGLQKHLTRDGVLEITEEDTLAGVTTVQDKAAKIISALRKQHQDGRFAKMTGMSSNQAKAIIATAKRAGTYDEMLAVGQTLREAAQFSLDVAYNAGMITDAKYDEFVNKYEFYVPIPGFGRYGFGESFGFKLEGTQRMAEPYGDTGAEFEQLDRWNLTGRNVISYTFANLRSRIVEAEVNITNRYMEEFAYNNPNAGVFTLYLRHDKRLIPDYQAMDEIERYDYEQQNGFSVTPDFSDASVWTREAIKKYEQLNDLIPVYHKGELAHIKINHAGMNRAYKLTTSPRKLHGAMKAIGKINRWLIGVNTMFNPEFLLPNLVKDYGAAFNTLSMMEVVAGMPGKEFASKFSGRIKDSMLAIRAYNFKGDPEKLSPKARALYDMIAEFEETGAKIQFPFMESVAETMADIAKGVRVRQGKGTALENAGAFKDKMMDVMKDFADIFENATRLSAYTTARESGMSKERAALLARELTVDFDRKGELGEVFNMFYLFANAGLQGTLVVLRTIANNPGLAAKHLGKIVALSAAVGAASMLMGGDGDDGEPRFFALPAEERNKHMVLMLPFSDGFAIKIPVPYVYGFCWAAGQELVNAMFDRRGMAQAALGIGSSFLDNFNPVETAAGLDDSHGWARLIAPTLADPFVDIVFEQTAFGTPLMPKQVYGTQPDSQRHWRSVSDASRIATREINSLMGGSAGVSGMVDMSPETVDLLFENGIGGLGKFLARVVGVVTSPLTGRPMTANDIPLARRFLTSSSTWADRGVFKSNFDEVHGVVRTYNELKDNAAMAVDPTLRRQAAADLAAFTAENSHIMAMRGRFNDAYSKVKGIDKQKERLYKSGLGQGEIAPQLEALSKRQREVYTKLNSQYYQTVDAK